MSYSIEYNRQFIKTENGYTPCWLVGDNNVTEGFGRNERRVRNWSVFMNLLDVSEDELVEKAKELFNVAENELIKASELQLTLSIDIGDMLNDENFKPYLDKIIIGNWIRVRANDIIYKLRLITINISGDEFDNVSFEFSNVTKFKDGISDAQDLISKVQSITSSFDYVAHQSESNDEVIEDIEDMYIYGIDASNIPIVSDENQNVVYGLKQEKEVFCYYGKVYITA